MMKTILLFYVSIVIIYYICLLLGEKNISSSIKSKQKSLNTLNGLNCQENWRGLKMKYKLMRIKNLKWTSGLIFTATIVNTLIFFFFAIYNFSFTFNFTFIMLALSLTVLNGVIDKEVDIITSKLIKEEKEVKNGRGNRKKD